MTDPTSTDDNKLIAERRAKLAKLREAGNAFPNDFRRTAMAVICRLNLVPRPKRRLLSKIVPLLLLAG